MHATLDPGRAWGHGSDLSGAVCRASRFFVPPDIAQSNDEEA